MRLRTRIFELPNNGYKNLAELAQTMEISVSQIYRVRGGKRHINQKFILGATKAFPGYKLYDLFYLAPDVPTVNNQRHRHSATHSTAKDKPSAKEQQPVESTR